MEHHTTVVADDTDILVLLVHHLQPNMSDILMLSEAMKGQSVGVKCVSVRNVQRNIGPTSVQQLLVVHALSGFDTTSAIFRHGKASDYKKLTSMPITQPLTDALLRCDLKLEEVTSAGIKLIMVLYGGK